MKNKKASTFKVPRDAQKGKFITSGPRKPYAPLETIRREVTKRSIPPVRDTKTRLSNAIFEAARDDAEKSKSLTIKKAKRARRDVIVKTIMRHNRQAH
ncbi:hypothetical protein F4009_06735 [Candidatus Poribacteria bacterium]|nr:hypothetical protein [Candidatus Poribacteria bacterium]MYH80931.1 hypothetical protein [Candidatus Poribacteria bacterium]MYK93685.1 hypothetical protein [Candidatus Poribacteria bacterium]